MRLDGYLVLLRLVRASPSLASIAVLNAESKTIMNRYGT